MPHASINLTIPEDVWIGKLTRSYPSTRFRILAALAGDRAGVGLAEIEGPDLESLLAEMASYETVTDFDLLQSSGDRALVQFETTLPLLLLPVQDSGVPLEMPFEIVDGEATWEITAPRDRLSALGEQLDAFGIPFTVERIQQRLERERLLTDRQESLLRSAVELGYYDTPREISLTGLADEVDLAKSTVSETLHRAEEAIVKQYVERELLDADSDGRAKELPPG